MNIVRSGRLIQIVNGIASRFICFLLWMLTATAQADFIQPTNDIQVSHELTDFDRLGDHTYNGNGIIGAPTVTETSFHLNGEPFENNNGNIWEAQRVNPQAISDHFIVYDLGSTKTLDKIYLWNYPRGGGTDFAVRGVNQFDFYVGQDGATITPTTQAIWQGRFIYEGTFNATKVPSAADFQAQTFSLSPVIARYVMIDIRTNHGGANFVGFSEIGFNATAVPEPSVFGLFSLATAGLVFWTFRHKKKSLRSSEEFTGVKAG